MLKEIDAFFEEKSKVEQRIAELDAEIQTKRSELRQANAKYQRMVAADNSGEESYSVSEFAVVQRRIDELTSEIRIAEQRRQALQENSRQRLKKPFDELDDARRQETRQITDRLLQHGRAGRELRAKMLLFAAEAYPLYARALELARTYDSARSAFDTDPYAAASRPPVSLGIPQSLGEIEGRITYGQKKDARFLPDLDEMDRVFRTGELPAWVKHYVETGELVYDEDLKATK